MPNFPRYNSKNQLTSQLPGPLMEKDRTGEVVAQAGNQLGKAIGDFGVKWQQGKNTIQKTQTEAKFKTTMLDIQNRASIDPDEKNSYKYMNEIEKLKQTSLSEIDDPQARAEMDIDLNYQSRVGQIQVENLYRKKLADIGQASMFTMLDHMARDSGDIGKRIDKFMKTQVNALVVDHKDVKGIKDKYVQQAKYNSFFGDLNADTAAAEKKLNDNEYKLDITQMKFAKSVLKQHKEMAIKKEMVAFNEGEQKIGELFLNDSPTEEIVSELEMAKQTKTISDENYNLAKASIGEKNAPESDSETLVSLMKEYAGIASSSDPVKAQRDFRNKVLIDKPDLSERHFKQFLQWTGSEKLEKNGPKMSGLEKFIEGFKKWQKKDTVPKDIKNLMDISEKYINEEYKVGQKISKGGRYFEVVKKDDGSLGFKALP